MSFRRSHEAILGREAEETHIKDDDHIYYLKLVARALIEKFTPMKVLDVGCGGGNLVLHFREQGVTSVGIDISDQRFMKEIRGALAVANGENLPFKEESFDLVIAHHVIEHLQNPEHFILEVRRVLKEEGAVFIVTTIPPLGATKLWRMLRLQRSVDHISLYNRPFWIKTFEKHGFQLIGNFDELLQKDPPVFFGGRVLLKFGPVGRKLWARMAVIIRGSFLFKLEN